MTRLTTARSSPSSSRRPRVAIALLFVALLLLLAAIYFFWAVGQAPQNDMRPLAGEKPHILRFNRTVQVTPDAQFQIGGFARINYVPATDRFVVTFGTKRAKVAGICNGSGYAYKEYTLDMLETGKSGYLIRYPAGACEAGDSGSVMEGNAYYLASVPQEPGYPYGWRLTKFNASDWTILADRNVSLDSPHEADTDPSVSFVNGQLDVSNLQFTNLVAANKSLGHGSAWDKDSA